MGRATQAGAVPRNQRTRSAQQGPYHHKVAGTRVRTPPALYRALYPPVVDARLAESQQIGSSAYGRGEVQPAKYLCITRDGSAGDCHLQTIAVRFRRANPGEAHSCIALETALLVDSRYR